VLTRRICSPALGGVLAFTLLMFAVSGAAVAQSNDVRQSAARAQERYYGTYGQPQPIDAGTVAAKAQERYYSSYGEPETSTQPPSSSDDTPWLPIAIAITLAVITASATHLRRLRVRRRRAARVTA